MTPVPSPGITPGITEDRLLDGRVLLHQPSDGLRAGLDAVMLAAHVPARPGEAVLELGCGSGAALLCLLARVPDLTGIGVERDPGLATLAAENLRRNGWEGRATIRTADIAEPDALPGQGFAAHGLANPPYWTGGTASPDPRRAAAVHEAEPAPLRLWAQVLARGVRMGGSATLILPAHRHGEGWAALREAGFGAVSLFPLWPRAGREAKRVLLQGWRGRRGPDRVLPGLVLHEGQGWSAGAEAVLRQGTALPG
ncbi:methyltransferase [Roseomonas gilardii subsp. gilardii]|uniref:tRNA1(Val) (adenine(37)-N6)-methyltransferase n=1 Tax=Roseomonas gilardii TaxID=257708 RepID=UPI001FF99655|nr:methyltransferase [Roseomonas gilardii]UPG71380.1 methyltransferase [Roseomonas gilardii subsp. gilardii]